MRTLLQDGRQAHMPAPPEKQLLINRGTRIELWDMRKPICLKVLADSVHLCGFFVQQRDLLVWTAWDVFILENAIPGA